MNGRVLLAAAGAAAISGMAQAQTSVRLDRLAARVQVIPERRGDVSVAVQQGPSRLPPLVLRRKGDSLVVDGGLARPGGGLNLRCQGGRGRFGLTGGPGDDRAVEATGVGRVALRDLPLVTVRLPLDARVTASGAVWGEVGATRSLALGATGCGDWAAGGVQQQLDAEVTGDGGVRVAAAGSVHGRVAGSGNLEVGRIRDAADLSVTGSGDIHAGAVGGPVKLGVAGSGDVDLASVQGPVAAELAASGEIRIHGGGSPDVHVRIAGSGDFDLKGQADRLDAHIVGSGSVRVARVSGPVSKSVLGSGEVRIGP